MKQYLKFKGQLYNHKKEEELKNLMGNEDVVCDRPIIDIYVRKDDVIAFHHQYDDDANLLDRVDVHTAGGHSFTLLCDIETLKKELGL